MNLNSLDIENNILPQHSQKPFWLYKYPSKHVSVCVRKNIWTALFLDAKELYCWSTLKVNVCIFLHISVRKFLFQRRRMILSDGGWAADWGRLNSFPKKARCLGLIKCLIETFWNSSIFQHFDTFIYSIKTLKFSRQFGFQG